MADDKIVTPSTTAVEDGWTVSQPAGVGTGGILGGMTGGGSSPGYFSRTGRRIMEAAQDLNAIPQNTYNLVTGGGQGRFQAGMGLLGGIAAPGRAIYAPIGAAAENAAVNTFGTSEETGRKIGDWMEAAGGIATGYFGPKAADAWRSSFKPGLTRDEQIAQAVQKSTGLDTGAGGAMEAQVSALYKLGDAKVGKVEPHQYLTAVRDIAAKIDQSGALPKGAREALIGKNGQLTQMIEKYEYMASNGIKAYPSYWNREAQELQHTIRSLEKGANPDTNVVKHLQDVRQSFTSITDKWAPEYKQGQDMSFRKQYADELFDTLYTKGKTARDTMALRLQTDSGAARAYGVYSKADQEAFLKSVDVAAQSTDPKSKLAAAAQMVAHMATWEGKYLMGRFLFDIARGR